MTLTKIASTGVEDSLRWVLGANGTSDYTFTGPGLTGTVNDPTIYLTRGHTYIFQNNSGGHPFYIKTSIANGGTSDAYNTGVTNNGGGNGTEIVFTVPHDSPDILYYQCSSHASMAGQFNIAGSVADGSITTAKIATDAITNAKLANPCVQTENLTDNSVTTAKIANDAVTTAQIANGTITNADINASAAIAGTKISPVFGAQTITGAGGEFTGNVIVNGNNGIKVENSYPRIFLTDTDSNSDYSIINNNGEYTVYDDTNGANRFRILANGTAIVTGNLDVGASLDVTGTVTSTSHLISGGMVDISDGNQLRLGNSQDMMISHDGSSAGSIRNATGELYLRSDGIRLVNNGNSETYVKCINNGAVELYHNNVQKLTTTSQGIDVSQGTNNFSNFHHGGGNSGIRIAGPAASSGANLVFANNFDVTTSDEWAISLDGSTDDLVFKANGTGGTDRVRFLDSGGICFGTDTAQVNALDDYEEGSWTPSLTSGTATWYNQQWYTKIGRMVTCYFYMYAFSDSSSSTHVRINGLPFPCTFARESSFSITTGGNPSLGSGSTGVFGRIGVTGTTTQITLYRGFNSSTSSLTHAQLGSGHYYATFSYPTDS